MKTNKLLEIIENKLLTDVSNFNSSPGIYLEVDCHLRGLVERFNIGLNHIELVLSKYISSHYTSKYITLKNFITLLKEYPGRTIRVSHVINPDKKYTLGVNKNTNMGFRNDFCLWDITLLEI